jgi:hypothetical protein
MKVFHHTQNACSILILSVFMRFVFYIQSLYRVNVQKLGQYCKLKKCCRRGLQAFYVASLEISIFSVDLAVNAKVATVFGSIPASSGTVESEGRQMT